MTLCCDIIEWLKYQRLQQCLHKFFSVSLSKVSLTVTMSIDAKEFKYILGFTN